MAEHELRVYYEDTDLAGVVYYANYLKYLERGRTEALRGLGVSQARLREETGLVFAVTRVELDYRAPARLDDLLNVETRLSGLGLASLAMAQAVRRRGTVLAEGTVRIACIGANGRVRRIPPDLQAALARLSG